MQITAENGDRPRESVSFSEFSSFVCRAARRGGGSFHAGHLNSSQGHCLVTVGRQVFAFRKYQVLVNVDEAARLEWKKWRRFDQIPLGSVSVDQGIFVAKISEGELHTCRWAKGSVPLKVFGQTPYFCQKKILVILLHPNNYFLIKR